MQSMQKLRTRAEQTDGKMESCPAAVAGCWLIRVCVRRDDITPDVTRCHTVSRVTLVTLTVVTPLFRCPHTSGPSATHPAHNNQRVHSELQALVSLHAAIMATLQQCPSSKQYWQEVPRPRDTPAPAPGCCMFCVK